MIRTGAVDGVTGGRAEYVTDEAKRSLYWNIPIANTTTVPLGTGTSLTQAASFAFAASLSHQTNRAGEAFAEVGPMRARS